MSENRRFYWLKLHKDFFKSKRIKKLRSVAGGNTYTIIYLKMQLLSLEDEGHLYYTGLESTFAEELALDLDENPDDVSVTISFLMGCGLLEMVSEEDYLLPSVKEYKGSEGLSAERVRNFRNRKALQCNTDVTSMKRNGNVEIEIEKDIDIYKEKVNQRESRFVKPTAEEVQAYCDERGNGISGEAFVDFYESKGWKVGSQPMKDWKAAVRTWEQKRRTEPMKADPPKARKQFGFECERTTDYDAVDNFEKL